MEYVTRQPQPLEGLQLQTLEIMFVPLEKPATSRKQIRLHKPSGERIKLAFANRAAKSQFVDYIKQTNPSVTVYR